LINTPWCGPHFASHLLNVTTKLLSLTLQQRKLMLLHHQSLKMSFDNYTFRPNSMMRLHYAKTFLFFPVELDMVRIEYLPPHYSNNFKFPTTNHLYAIQTISFHSNISTATSKPPNEHVQDLL